MKGKKKGVDETHLFCLQCAEQQRERFAKALVAALLTAA
jgi:hypothetical protein